MSSSKDRTEVLCTNIKCSQCSAEYNYGPGIMERIRCQ